jgi:hypothetical protein
VEIEGRFARRFVAERAAAPGGKFGRGNNVEDVGEPGTSST